MFKGEISVPPLIFQRMSGNCSFQAGAEDLVSIPSSAWEVSDVQVYGSGQLLGWKYDQEKDFYPLFQLEQKGIQGSYSQLRRRQPCRGRGLSSSWGVYVHV